MRQYTALLLIALIAVSTATETNKHSPADAVLERIDQLVQSARNEQADSTRIYVSQLKRCKDEKAFRAKEISDATVAQGAADQQLAICKAEVPVASQSRKQSQSELLVTNEQLSEINVEYNQQQQINLERQREHAEALSNIQTAYNIIGQFANGKAALNKAIFTQVTQKLNSIFKIAVKHKFHKSLIPVMGALLQITAGPSTQVSTSQLQRVVALFRKLESDVKASEADRVAQWNAYVALYNKQKQLLQRQQAALTEIIKRYDLYLQNLSTCIRTESNILKLATDKYNRNNNILHATEEMCDAYELKYKVQTKERNEYVVLLGQLRNFVVSAIHEFKSGIYETGDFTHTL